MTVERGGKIRNEAQAGAQMNPKPANKMLITQSTGIILSILRCNLAFVGNMDSKFLNARHSSC